ncbi:MAG TPA: hypothetical protein IAB72_02680 [Candidatus Onthoplasma faecipullorum]|nr:hypothetical protein [Candidatus Onthoplasma faecipullorum]
MQKRIWAIVSLSIIGILIIATIIMANVDVNYKINCANPDIMWVQHASGNQVRVEGDEYDEILNYINNASKESSLTALFGGRINDTATVTSNGSTATSIPSTTNYYVIFEYNNPQKLMVGNDSYKDGDGNEYYYRELVFTVNPSEESGQVRVYIKPFYNSNGDAEIIETYTRYYTVTADFSGLYNYLQDSNIA